MEPLTMDHHGTCKGVPKLIYLVYVFWLRQVYVSTPGCLVYVVQTILKNVLFL